MPATDSGSRSRRAVRSDTSSSAATSAGVTRARACSSSNVATNRSARMAQVLPEKRSGDGHFDWQSQHQRRPEESGMPGMTPPVADEREGLVAFLQQQRDAVRISAYGLTDEQARMAASAGALTIGGLVKHLADMERSWTATMTQRRREGGVDDY